MPLFSSSRLMRMFPRRCFTLMAKCATFLNWLPHVSSEATAAGQHKTALPSPIFRKPLERAK
ncbi:hypothetical protein HNR29_006547 [Rhizobium leguminosarum]|nr:hypothetical protein [Rhizobium leguminosarum]